MTDHSQGRAAQDIVADIVNMAESAFAKHVVFSRGPGWWNLARTYPDGAFQSIYFARIQIVAGALLVTGDIAPVMLQGVSLTRLVEHGDHAKDGETEVRARARGLIKWMAESELHYLTEKMAAGFRVPRDFFYESDTDVAMHGLRQLILEIDLDEDEDNATMRAAQRRIYSEAAGMLLDHRDVAEVRDWLHQEGVDPEHLGTFGQVLGARAVYAQVAVRKLHELLTAEETTVEQAAAQALAEDPTTVLCGACGYPLGAKGCRRCEPTVVTVSHVGNVQPGRETTQ